MCDRDTVKRLARSMGADRTRIHAWSCFGRWRRRRRAPHGACAQCMFVWTEFVPVARASPPRRQHFDARTNAHPVKTAALLKCAWARAVLWSSARWRRRNGAASKRSPRKTPDMSTTSRPREYIKHNSPLGRANFLDHSQSRASLRVAWIMQHTHMHYIMFDVRCELTWTTDGSERRNVGRPTLAEHEKPYKYIRRICVFWVECRCDRRARAHRMSKSTRVRVSVLSASGSTWQMLRIQRTVADN